MVRVGRKLVLFGGWDGKRDLGDLWEWELPRGNSLEGENGASEGGWRCVMSGEEGGDGEKRPGKRSCHQLAVDEKEGWVYLLGARRDDEEEEEDEREERGAIVVPENWDEEPSASSSNGAGGGDAMEIEEGGGEGGERRAKRRKGTKVDRWKSDFWRYKAVGPGRGKWELISQDTRNDGGPALLCDSLGSLILLLSPRLMYLVENFADSIMRWWSIQRINDFSSSEESGNHTKEQML